MKYLDGYKLFDDTYLCLFDCCMAVVKVNGKNEIVRIATFGKGEMTDEQALSFHERICGLSDKANKGK